jgi:hypothetical protein
MFYFAVAIVLLVLSMGAVSPAVSARSDPASSQHAPATMLATADEPADAGDWLDLDLALPLGIFLCIPVVQRGFSAARRSFSSFAPLLETPPPLRFA